MSDISAKLAENRLLIPGGEGGGTMSNVCIECFKIVEHCQDIHSVQSQYCEVHVTK